MTEKRKMLLDSVYPDGDLLGGGVVFSKALFNPSR